MLSLKKLGYDKPSKTPPVFTLETPKLKLKLKKKLKFRKKQLEKDLKSIEEEIKILSK